MMTDDDIPSSRPATSPTRSTPSPTLFGFTPEDSIIAISAYGRATASVSRSAWTCLPLSTSARGRQIVAHLTRRHAEGAIIIAVTDRTEAAAKLCRSSSGGSVRSGGRRRVGRRRGATGRRSWSATRRALPLRRAGRHVAVVQAHGGGRRSCRSGRPRGEAESRDRGDDRSTKAPRPSPARSPPRSTPARPLDRQRHGRPRAGASSSDHVAGSQSSRAQVPRCAAAIRPGARCILGTHHTGQHTSHGRHLVARGPLRSTVIAASLSLTGWRRGCRATALALVAQAGAGHRS